MTTGTTAKATPGPWRVLDESGRRAGKDWARIAPCIVGHKAIVEVLPIHEKGKREAGDFEIEVANARLIAASPLLFDYHKEIIKHLLAIETPLKGYDESRLKAAVSLAATAIAQVEK